MARQKGGWAAIHAMAQGASPKEALEAQPECDRDKDRDKSK
jgi:hypothetical protein